METKFRINVFFQVFNKVSKKCADLRDFILKKPKCLSFLLVQYAHMLMSHIFPARPIMASCAEFIICWTSLFLCLLSARFIVSCLTVLQWV